MTEPTEVEPPALPWYRRFGRRNLAYIAFTILLIPAAIGIESTGPRGPDAGGGIMAGLMLWGIVSLAFFVINAVLLVIALAKGEQAGKPLLACALPLAIVVGAMLLQDLTVP